MELNFLIKLPPFSSKTPSIVETKCNGAPLQPQVTPAINGPQYRGFLLSLVAL